MLIKVAELTKKKDTPGHYHFLLPPMELDDEGTRTKEPTRVTVKALYAEKNKGIILEGSFQPLVWAGCHRCLEEFSFLLTCEFEEEMPLEGEGAVNQENEPAFLGESIDLVLLARDHLVLSLPLKLVCRDDCKGMCHICGGEIESGKCTCSHIMPDPRLEKLGELLKD